MTVAEVIGAQAAADKAPNETGRVLAARYPAPEEGAQQEQHRAQVIRRRWLGCHLIVLQMLTPTGPPRCYRPAPGASASQCPT